MFRRMLGLLVCLLSFAAAQPDGAKPAISPVPTKASGDPLPPGALWRLGSGRLSHGSTIDLLRFSRDGKVLFSHASGTRLRAWEVSSGKEIALPFLPTEGAAAVAFSPEGRLLAIADLKGEVHVCDLQARRVLRRWSGGAGTSACLAVSADERSVAWVDIKGTIHLRDLATDKDRLGLASATKEKPDTDAPESLLAFSPDGKYLAARPADSGVLLWDLATGKRLRRYTVQQEFVPQMLEFVEEGRSLLGVSNDGAVRVWEVDSIEERLSFKEDGLHPTGLFVLHDRKSLAALAENNQVRLWSLADGKKIRTLALDATELTAIAFTADGKVLATGSEKGHICFWDAVTGKSRPPTPPREDVLMATFDATGKEVITVSPGKVRRWAADSGKRLAEVPLSVTKESQPVLSPDGARLALNDENQLRLFDTFRGKELATVQVEAPVTFEFLPNGRHLAVMSREEGKNEVLICDAATGKLRLTLKLEERLGPVTSLTISPDSRTLYVAQDNSSSLGRWELATGRPRHSLPLPGISREAPLVARSGLAGAGPPALGTFRVSIGPEMTIAPDNRQLAVPDGQRLMLLPLVGTGRPRWLEESDDLTGALCFSPDSELLVGSCGDGSVLRVWDVRSGTVRVKLEGLRGGVHQVAFSPDGKRLLTTSLDGTLVVWDVAETLRLNKPKSKPTPAARSLDVLWTDLGSDDGTVAETAQREMLNTPEPTVRFLARHVRPIPAVEPARLAKLIAELDSDDRTVRDQASKQLAGLDELAETELRKVSKTGSAEVKRQAKRLLDHIERFARTGIEVRPLRAVEVLEQLGTPSARKLLTELSRGAPEARLTQESAESLRRLRLRLGLSSEGSKP